MKSTVRPWAQADLLLFLFKNGATHREDLIVQLSKTADPNHAVRASLRSRRAFKKAEENGYDPNDDVDRDIRAGKRRIVLNTLNTALNHGNAVIAHDFVVSLTSAGVDMLINNKVEELTLPLADLGASNHYLETTVEALKAKIKSVEDGCHTKRGLLEALRIIHRVVRGRQCTTSCSTPGRRKQPTSSASSPSSEKSMVQL